MKRYFYTKDFAGYSPVGTSAIAVAKDPNDAWQLLAEAIRQAGLDPDDFTVHELIDGAMVLQDGDY